MKILVLVILGIGLVNSYKEYGKREPKKNPFRISNSQNQNCYILPGRALEGNPGYPKISKYTL